VNGAAIIAQSAMPHLDLFAALSGMARRRFEIASLAGKYCGAKGQKAVTGCQRNTDTQLGRPAIRIFAANERLNKILIENLPSAAWRATPPGKVRAIAAIFTHMHNVRTKWIRLTAPHLGVPPQLSRARCTPRRASAALSRSADRCLAMLAEALDCRAK